MTPAERSEMVWLWNRVQSLEEELLHHTELAAAELAMYIRNSRSQDPRWHIRHPTERGKRSRKRRWSKQRG